MATDPLSGHKATYDFLEEMLVPSVDDGDVEKAEDGDDMSPQAKRLYERCVSGAAGADDAEQVCSLLARDFDRRHPGGLDLGSEGGPTEEEAFEKTVSTAGMAADLGEPSATIELTDVPRRKRLPAGS